MKFPSGFIDHLKTVDGFALQPFTEAHLQPAPVSFRINPKKKFHLPEYAEKIPWCDGGYYLPERPQFTLDPLLHAGCYYVQEASSMFLEYVLKQVVDLQTSLKVLDLCAAPGGKSTLISSLLNEKSLLVSNEVIRSRVNVLKENVIKWGDANTIITNNDAADFSKLQNYFDVLVIDAPCSGSGLFRKDVKAMEEWSLENVNLCSRRQQRILEDVTPALKENGILIYSTCSYSAEENEEVVKGLIADCGFEIADLRIPEEWGIVKNNCGFRFYPDKVKGEGFFLSVLRKVTMQKNADAADSYNDNKIKLEKLADEEIKLVEQWVDENKVLEFYKKGAMIFAYPQNICSDIQFISSALKVIKAGVYCGEIKGKDFIPAHEFAVSDLVKKDIPAVEVDKETALNYLRKNEINITPTENKGWALVKYEGYNLGWVKILENRVNNYYPIEWRVKNF